MLDLVLNPKQFGIDSLFKISSNQIRIGFELIHIYIRFLESIFTKILSPHGQPTDGGVRVVAAPYLGVGVGT